MIGNLADLDATPDDIDHLLDAQSRTVDLLNRRSGRDWTVDAGAIPTYSQQACALDWEHGRGTVWFKHADGVCPSCGVMLLDRQLQAGDCVAIDVTR